MIKKSKTYHGLHFSSKFSAILIFIRVMNLSLVAAVPFNVDLTTYDEILATSKTNQAIDIVGSGFQQMLKNVTMCMQVS